MAIAILVEAPGMTAEDYDAVIASMDFQKDPPQGALAHIAGPMEGGWRVVDVWESKEAFEAFVEARLGPALQAANAPAVQPQFYPVHAMWAGAIQI